MKCRCTYCSEIASEVEMDKEVTLNFKEAKIFFDHQRTRTVAFEIKYCPFCGRQLIDIQEEI